MSSVLVILAVVGWTEASGLAHMISNYAKVTANTQLTTNQTNGYAPRTVIPTTETPEANVTDYEDFDDLESATEEPRQAPSNILKYVNGLVSLMALMYKFSGGSNKPHAPVRGRYIPDAATKKFRHQTDQENQPISNFPPYNPLAANSAESYNNGKTSFDADLEQYGTNKMSEYVTANDGHESHDRPNGWNAITAHDYPVYNPSDDRPRQPWRTPEYPVYQTPERPNVYHDPPEEDHFVEEEDRESKRPYSYYFLGRKLWYIPLIFSVYFIIYIGALVLKSVARHKIQFPDKLWDLKDEHYKHRRYRKVDEITEKYENAMNSIKHKFM